MKRKNEHIGPLNQQVAFYTPTYVRNTLGAAVPTWAVWKEKVWAGIIPVGGDETNIADKTIAVRKMKFRTRSQSIAGVNEVMVIRYKNEDYDITLIEDDPNQLPNTFKNITAERRQEVIAEVVAPAGPNGGTLTVAYSQKFANVTGNTVTVTAGTLPDPGSKDGTYFHNMLFVYRGQGAMVRVIYGDGYTVSGSVITFNETLRGENVLIHQYGEA